MSKSLQSYLKNWFLLILLTLTLLLREHIDPTLSGFLLGSSTLYLFMQIQKYGLRNSFWRARNTDIRRLFAYLKEGNLEEIKKIQQQMPVDQFLSLSQYGGFSMLFIACTQGHEDIVEYLLKLGADVNQEANNGETPLIRACYFNRTRVVELCIEHGANLEHRSRQEMTALLTAIVREKHLIVRYLLKRGAKLDLNSANILVIDKVREMKPEMRQVIEEYKRWQRLKVILKFHKSREQSKNYPQAFKHMNKNLFVKVLTEYI